MFVYYLWSWFLLGLFRCFVAGFCSQCLVKYSVCKRLFIDTGTILASPARFTLRALRAWRWVETSVRIIMTAVTREAKIFQRPPTAQRLLRPVQQKSFACNCTKNMRLLSLWVNVLNVVTCQLECRNVGRTFCNILFYFCWRTKLRCSHIDCWIPWNKCAQYRRWLVSPCGWLTLTNCSAVPGEAVSVI